MNVEEIMTHGLDSINPDDSVIQAAKIMEKDDLGCLAVMEHGKVIGVLSDRDIVVRGLTCGCNPSDIKVRQVMSGDPICCQTCHSVDDAAQLMKEHKLRRLIVNDEDGMAVGCISVGDIASRGHDDQLCGEVLEDVCAGHSMYI